MSDQHNPYNEKSSRVAQQAVKPQDAPREAYPAPVTSAPTRHRRSDRHREAGQESPAPRPSAPQPRREAYAPPAQEPPQWVRQQPPAEPGQEADFARPAPPRPSQRPGPLQEDPFMRRPVMLEEEYEDEEEPETRRAWPRIVLGVALALVIVCAALYFIPSAGPLEPAKTAVVGAVNAVKNLIMPQDKGPAQAISFQTVTSNGVVGSRILFHLTTTQAVEGVRIEDYAGTEIPCTVSLVNGEDETNKIWAITTVFNVAFESEVYAVIKDGNEWTRTDKWVMLTVNAPTPAPTETPAPTQTPDPTQAPTQAPTLPPAPTETPFVPAVIAEPAGPTNVPVPTWAAPLATDEPAPDPVIEATEEPTPEPTAEPTPDPTQAPTPVPTQAPTATPLPRLTAESAIDSAKVTDTVFSAGKTLSDYTREKGYIAPHPDQYAYYNAGVLTFRGDNFRRNAAFGTVEVEQEKLSVVWQSEIGSLRTADSGTLWGVGWTGQPAIVKWTTEVRQMMNLYEEKKNTKALREVIFAGQDGKIYFLDLTDGAATRDPISVGYPLKGSVSVDTYGRPLLAAGQGVSKLPSKTGDIGLHVFNLIDGSKAFFINGRKSDSQKQYSTNGAFDGTALFLYDSDAMVVAGENGLLYTVDLNSKFTYPNAEDPTAQGKLEINRETIYLRAKATAAKDTQASVESSVAMYDKYIYMADTYGLLRCVDSDTMKTVWAMDTGDNTDAAIALDLDGDAGVSLYTGNTAYARLGSKKDVTIRRLNALTGQEDWSYSIKCDYNKDQLSGCKASPVVGQNSIDHLVIFTVNMVQGGGSRVIALNKDTGSVAWEYSLAAETISSPVAVYNAAGKAWIIQADENGTLTLLDGLSGSLRSTLELGGTIQGSPAVYKDMLVIGTCQKDNSYMYGIQIQ